MNKRFLELYDTELRHLRHSAAEFAQHRPQTAKHLGIDPDGRQLAKDPFVERLLEGFSFLAARVHYQLDAEFPRFTQGLLETVYPDYLAPKPSTGVIQFTPDVSKDFACKELPVGSEIFSDTTNSGGTRCQFRTTQHVNLYPLNIMDVRYMLGSNYMGSQHDSILSIKLDIFAKAQNWSTLECDELKFYLPGSDNTPSQLLSYLMTDVSGFEIFAHTDSGEKVSCLFSPNDLRIAGFAPEEALLPRDSRTFDGYRLLREYFVLPKKFHFFELKGLRDFLDTINTHEIEIRIGLKSANSSFQEKIDKNSLELFCSPVVNLFEKSRRSPFDIKSPEHHIIMDRTRAYDYEIYRVLDVKGYGGDAGDERDFQAFYLNQEHTRSGSAFYTMRREPFPDRGKTSTGRSNTKSLPHRGYLGSEVYLTLVDSESAPYPADIQQLGVKALCTNRHLPLLMIEGGIPSFSFLDSDLVESVNFLTGPTAPQASWAEGNVSWRIISHLSLNYQSLLAGEETSTAAFKELLSLYSEKDRPEIHAFSSITATDSQALHRFSSGPPAFIRGMDVKLTFDENIMDRFDIILFSRVLEEFIGRYAAINSFTRTTVETLPHFEQIISWPKRMGQAHLV